MRTIEKTVELLLLLARAPGPIRLDGIAPELKMPCSRAYEFLKSLKKDGLVANAGDAGNYRLATRTLEFCQDFLNVYSLRETAVPYGTGTGYCHQSTRQLSQGLGLRLHPAPRERGRVGELQLGARGRGARVLPGSFRPVGTYRLQIAAFEWSGVTGRHRAVQG